MTPPPPSKTTRGKGKERQQEGLNLRRLSTPVLSSPRVGDYNTTYIIQQLRGGANPPPPPLSELQVSQHLSRPNGKILSKTHRKFTPKCSSIFTLVDFSGIPIPLYNQPALTAITTPPPTQTLYNQPALTTITTPPPSQTSPCITNLL